jgi:hypothetical protein
MARCLGRLLASLAIFAALTGSTAQWTGIFLNTTVIKPFPAQLLQSWNWELAKLCHAGCSVRSYIFLQHSRE